MLTKRQKQVLDYIKNFKDSNGFSPSLEEIEKFLRLSSVSTAHYHVKALENQGYLKKIENSHRSIEVLENNSMIQVPILGRISAGQPILAIENKEIIAVPKNKVPPLSEVYALQVVGNSMVEENIHDGDIVLVHRQDTASNGQKVVALIDNNEATLKKFYKERGQVRLQPANRAMEPLIFRNGHDVSIQGIVLDVIHEELLPVKAVKDLGVEVSKQSNLPLDKIICGSAVDVMKTFPSDSIDLVVTSPPYDELREYKSYVFDFEGIAKGLYRTIREGGVLVWVVGDKINKGNRSLTSLRQAIFFQNLGFNAHDIMIFKKKNTPFMRSNAYTNCYEFMFIFSKGSPKTFNPLKTRTVRQGNEMLPFNKGADGVNKKILGELKSEKTLTNVWEYAVGLHGSTSDKFAFQHPAVFPERLAEDHILSWTKVGDVVFDPMCGSGTTCKMAAVNNRHYIGCDVSEDYANLSKRRLENISVNMFL